MLDITRASNMLAFYDERHFGKCFQSLEEAEVCGSSKFPINFWCCLVCLHTCEPGRVYAWLHEHVSFQDVVVSWCEFSSNVFKSTMHTHQYNI